MKAWRPHNPGVKDAAPNWVAPPGAAPLSHLRGPWRSLHITFASVTGRVPHATVWLRGILIRWESGADLDPQELNAAFNDMDGVW